MHKSCTTADLLLRDLEDDLRPLERDRDLLCLDLDRDLERDLDRLLRRERLLDRDRLRRRLSESRSSWRLENNRPTMSTQSKKKDS